MGLFAELKRRNVFRVGIAYALVSWLVLQVADVVLNNIEAPDWVFQTLMLVLAIGLPVVLVFSWVYEMTPEGIRREQDVDRAGSITPHTGRKLDRLITVALALAVALLLLDRLGMVGSESNLLEGHSSQQVPRGDLTLTPALPGSPTTIAVLPFVNMSADQENEYFSDGISEELLNVLVKVNSLHVASRTSTFAYKDKELPVTQIASELKVDNVVEGSVRKAGNRVRITAQLIDARNDRHLWSETYERELDDIFEIQEEISNAIVDALKIALDVDEAQAMERSQRPTGNTEAYELYLQGRHLWRLRGEANVRAAIDLFRRATELDPLFAAAWESMAAATGSLSSWSDVTPREAIDESIIYARKALELDPTRAEARAIVAEWHGGHWRWAEMIGEYRQALADEPHNGLVHQWRAEVLGNLGYLRDALDELQQAYALDPALGVISNVIIYTAIAAGQYEMALKHWKIASGMGMAAAANRNVAELFLMRGDVDELIAAHGWSAEEVPLCYRAAADPASRGELAVALKTLDFGDRKAVERIIGPPRNVAVSCFVLAEDHDGAMDMLDPFIRNQDWYAISAFWSPEGDMKRLRSHPRFRQLVLDMGLVEYWRAHGWPDQCIPVGDDDFACDQ